MSKAAEYQRAYRARAKAKHHVESNGSNALDSVKSSPSPVLTIVEQFQKMNAEQSLSCLKPSRLVKPRLLVKRVLSDPDLKYLVESIWFQSPSQQDKC